MTEVLEDHERSKRRREFALIVLVGLLFASTTYFEYRLSDLSSRLPFVNSIFFFGLINFNIVLLMILVLLIARNVGKLVLERRRQALGSRLKTKLVLAFLGFTVVPTVSLFLISSLYINSSFDKWFSLKILNTLQTSLEITQTYYKNTSRVATYLASQVASEVNDFSLRFSSEKGYRLGQKRVALAKLETSRRKSGVDVLELYIHPIEERLIVSGKGELLEREIEVGGGDVEAEGENSIPRLPMDILDRVFRGETVSLIQHVKGADLIRAVAPSWDLKRKVRAAAAVTFLIPTSLVNRVDAVSSTYQDYSEVNPLKYPVKSTYFLILVMMTALILFVSIWFGLYLARQLTTPLESLVTATQKIGQGDLDFQIFNTGHDEIARLTDSFNSMTQDLRKKRGELELNNRELAAKNAYIETLINSVTAGVISVESGGLITTMNPSAGHLLGVDAKSYLGKPLRDLARASGADTLWSVFSSGRFPQQAQFSLDFDGQIQSLSMAAVALQSGAVFVLDDASYANRVQREAAWREVARRIAHEIKNPLTPIQLAAQRLQKRLPGTAFVDECTSTIVKSVEELREMVNEFSEFARFPAPQPATHDLGVVLREITALYQNAHKSIQFELDLPSQPVVFDFDRDLIKRAVINLVENACAVLEGELSSRAGKVICRVQRHQSHSDGGERVHISVIDNGPGIPPELKQRIFEPYFSTKSQGTGLGLAIVKRVVEDHRGVVYVESVGQDERGAAFGTVFHIEIPVIKRVS